MAISFAGKVAIVTGAGGGLGRCHALELARRGAKIVVNDLGGSLDGTGGNSAASEKVVAEIKAAGGEAIPPAWTAQLAVGGRLVAPMQTATGQQALVVIDKTAEGLRQTVLEAVHFVPLKSGTN
jgi:NAD(P)-dependent dehydrogenase (short-subunit alcohol dehydrogenase family)